MAIPIISVVYVVLSPIPVGQHLSRAVRGGVPCVRRGPAWRAAGQLINPVDPASSVTEANGFWPPATGEATMENQEAHGRVVSDTPGRLRIRVHHPRRHSEVMGRTRDHLEGKPGIRGVETNSTTGSVTVKYDAQQASPHDVLAMLKDVGVIAEEMASNLGVEMPHTGRSTTAVSVISVFDDLDRRISLLTGRKVDLKVLFPAALFAVGIRQVAAQGLGLSQVPGYILLWYAFDSFWKFHQEEPVESTKTRHPEVEPAQEPSQARQSQERRTRSPRTSNA